MFAKVVKSKGKKLNYSVIVDAQNHLVINGMRYIYKDDANEDCKRYNDEVSKGLKIGGYKE